MSPRELAGRLSGRQIGSEMTKEDRQEAKESGIVVVYGYSDDGMAIRGAVDHFVDCYGGGGVVHLTRKGVLVNHCDCLDCPYHAFDKKRASKVESFWDDKGNPCWSYKTDIPHVTFDIFEDDELFCRGIVFYLSDVIEGAILS